MSTAYHRFTDNQNQHSDTKRRFIKDNQVKIVTLKDGLSKITKSKIVTLKYGLSKIEPEWNTGKLLLCGLVLLRKRLWWHFLADLTKLSFIRGNMQGFRNPFNLCCQTIVKGKSSIMVIKVVEFSSGGYKIRKIFA